jgi:hypothetical protein
MKQGNKWRNSEMVEVVRTVAPPGSSAHIRRNLREESQIFGRLLGSCKTEQ